MENNTIDFDKLKVDLFASLSEQSAPVKRATEAVSEDFSAGTVSQIKTIMPMKQKKLTNSLESEAENPVENDFDNEEINDDSADSIEFLVDDIIQNAELLLSDIDAGIKGIVNEEIRALRGSGDFDKAKTLREAFISLRDAADNLRDACELIESLL